MSRHESRQKLAREFGATDIVTERGDEGVERIKELTNGIGADSVLECVGTQESMVQAIQSTRRGGHVGYVGVPHGVDLNGEQLFYAHVHLHGGPAPVRRFLPRARRKGQRLPSSLLIENASDRDSSSPRNCAPRRFRSSLATMRLAIRQIQRSQPGPRLLS